ncbi:MAG: hypothetical protein QOK10_2845 [Pseudonocardiales bacterium]|nr:hypothetical protein [Pseudonocardiales bacterium]
MTMMVSGEAVPFDLQRAGVGSRTVAGVLDIIVQVFALLAAILLDAALLRGDDAILGALLIIEVVAILGGYPIAFEWLSRGRTLGKMAMGLRVVRDDGGPIGFRQALVRGLSSLLLEKPGLIFPVGTAAGMAVLTFTPSSKRIGDLLAGTFVLSERAGSATSMAPSHQPLPFALQGWAAMLDLSRFDDQLALALRQFIQRAPQLSPAAQHELGEQFRRHVESVIAPPPPSGVPTPVLLTAVLAERRRRATLAEQQRAVHLASPGPLPTDRRRDAPDGFVPPG